MGYLFFSLVVHPLLTYLSSDLVLGYLDDFTLGGPLNTVAANVASIRSKGASLGSFLNAKKSEVILRSSDTTNSQFTGFRQLTLHWEILQGARVSSVQAMDDISSTLFGDLKLAVNRLQLISAHDGLVLLKTCLGGPKLLYFLRTSPCCDHPPLHKFDGLLQLAITETCNIALTDNQWTQASLPDWSGGVGIRTVSTLAQSAFLASAAGTLPSSHKFLEIPWQLLKTSARR